MESDERFKHLVNDKRFKPLRKSQRKVKIDPRFQSMFTDEKFTLKYSKDKRGRKQNKNSGDDLKKYYSLENEDEEPSKPQKDDKEPKLSVEKEVQESKKDEEESDKVEESEEDGTEVEDEEDGAEVEDEEDEDDELSDLDTASEVSTSSDEPDSDPEDYVSDVDVDVNQIKYDWKPLDHDAETAEATTNRLAIQNLDWDKIDVRDLYVLVNSIRPPLNVRLYISEFGKERLAREEKEGPLELAEMPKVDEEEEEFRQLEEKMSALENQNIVGKSKKLKPNEYEDADEAIDTKDDEIRERIRRYQLSRMKYYYAVAEFDSVESAEVVYKELDGMEYEGSSLELDLRFVPDVMEFSKEDMKAECNKLPDLASYKAPQFINMALQQTTVKFSWDETDSKRQEKLRRAFTKEELDKDDLEVYLASESDSEFDEDEDDADGAEEGQGDTMSVVTANSEARANKYRQLLASLDEEAAKKKKVDVDVDWSEFDQKSGDDDDDEDDEEDDDDDDVDELDDEDDDERVHQDEQSVSESDSGNQRHEQRQRRRKKPKSSKLAAIGASPNENAELDLMVMDVKEPREEFKFNPDDERFTAVYESGKYNIDPSHPNFKRTPALDQIAQRKREKRLKSS